MKSYILIILSLLINSRTLAINANIDSLFFSLHKELADAGEKYEKKLLALTSKLMEISNALKSNEVKTKEKLELLIEKSELEDSKYMLFLENQSEISKIRYKKGLQIIKLLNEKMLSLDHHFATIKTFNEISKIANPNSYPEFQKVKEFLKKGNEKKNVEFTSLLNSNIYTSIIGTVINLFVNNSNRNSEEKKEQLEQISCVIDFTLRMNQDLNTIYYETAFLQGTNISIKSDLEALFKDYTKPLDFKQSLQDCRANDDWDKITDDLERYLDKLNTEQTKGPNSSRASKMQVNLEFSIDRLLQFISLYNSFINQCVQYYNKFKVVLTNYENEKKCADKIPAEFKKLRDDIDISIEKFNTAYSTVELNGSKMKELLYGLAEN